MSTKAKNNISLNNLILFQDDELTIINKPSGLSTLDDRASESSVLSLAKENNPNTTPCHRLDKDTTGVLVLANTDEAYKYMAIKFEDREIKKVYHAVANGLKSFDNFEADESIYSSSSKSRVDRNGKPSLTLFQTLELFKKHTLVKCFPVTGRMHQIRVHLSHHEAPMVNDPIYGGKPAYLSELKRNFNLKKHEEESPMIKRLALHARSITFEHPKTGETMKIEAPYPKDFKVLLKQLRKFN